MPQAVAHCRPRCVAFACTPSRIHVIAGMGPWQGYLRPVARRVVEASSSGHAANCRPSVTLPASLSFPARPSVASPALASDAHLTSKSLVANLIARNKYPYMHSHTSALKSALFLGRLPYYGPLPGSPKVSTVLGFTHRACDARHAGACCRGCVTKAANMSLCFQIGAR
jgi:hypothetical protein